MCYPYTFSSKVKGSTLHTLFTTANMLSLVAILSFVLLFVNFSIAGYVLEDDYSPSNFFDMFTFFTDSDPTNGFVEYVSESTAQDTGLINATDSSVYMGVDYTNVAPNGRSSVRITSNKAYNSGSLVIVDIEHMPGGICGTWPAFWMVGPNWPAGGEIDIIEGVNLQLTNDITLHSGDGCEIENNGDFTGSLTSQDCYAYANGNQGCQIGTSNPDSYGAGFNSVGGGVYAMQWTDSAISVWFFSRGQIPDDITSGSPAPSGWGSAMAKFTGCDFPSFFYDNQIVFDTTFCGDWAGNVWSTSECAAKADTCSSYVENNPGDFEDAYWSINGLQVYTSVAGSESVATTSSAAATSTSTSAAEATTTSSSVDASTWSVYDHESLATPTETSSAVESTSSSESSTGASTTSSSSSSESTSSSTSSSVPASTTSSASTTIPSSSASSVLSSASAAASTCSQAALCPGCDGQVIDSDGTQFNVACDVSASGSVLTSRNAAARLRVRQAETLETCISECAANDACVAASFDTSTTYCTLYSAITSASSQSGIQFAYVYGSNVTIPAAGSSSSTSSAEANSTTSSTPLNTTSTSIISSGVATTSANATTTTAVVTSQTLLNTSSDVETSSNVETSTTQSAADDAANTSIQATSTSSSVYLTTVTETTTSTHSAGETMTNAGVTTVLTAPYTETITVTKTFYSTVWVYYGIPAATSAPNTAAASNTDAATTTDAAQSSVEPTVAVETSLTTYSAGATLTTDGTTTVLTTPSIETITFTKTFYTTIYITAGSDGAATSATPIATTATLTTTAGTASSDPYDAAVVADADTSDTVIEVQEPNTTYVTTVVTTLPAVTVTGATNTEYVTAVTTATTFQQYRAAKRAEGQEAWLREFAVRDLAGHRSHRRRAQLA